ncbi:MAG: autotransporter outer membrane beta-barrel domain-containing protein, partial [Acinetobacter sp.]|nr:autotransporter outer membrane beta-barrel domain-containing protein [Acinetobacter sp.]
PARTVDGNASAAAAAKAEADRIAAEKAAAEAAAKAEAERIAAEKAAAEAAQAEAERIAAEQKQAELVSRYANTALSDISAQTNAALLLGQSVQQHILSTRTEPLTVWVNQQWNRQNHRSDLYRSYQQDSRLTQFGVEKDLADHNRLRAGLILTDLRTDNQFDQATGENQLFSTNAYVKYTAANGVFTSADLGYTHANNELRVDQSNVEFKRNMTNVGLTLGKTWNLSWVEIQPSIAARLHYLQGSNYQLNGANVQIDPSKVLALHAGLQISKELKVGEMNLRPILTTSYVNTQNNDFNVQVNQYRLQQSIGNRLHHSLGLAAKLKNWEMSTNVGYVQNDENEDQYHGGVQLNYSW